MNNGFCGICFIELVFFIDREIEFSYVWIIFIGSWSMLFRLIKLVCFVYCGVIVNVDIIGIEMVLYFIYFFYW